MEKLPERQIKKQLFWTNGCYRAALMEFYDARLTKKEKRMNLHQLKERITKGWNEKMPAEVHTIYIRRLLSLPSNKLSIILLAFQTGQQYRKQETVDAIMTELFERSANPESKENA